MGVMIIIIIATGKTAHRGFALLVLVHDDDDE